MAPRYLGKNCSKGGAICPINTRINLLLLEMLPIAIVLKGQAICSSYCTVLPGLFIRGICSLKHYASSLPSFVLIYLDTGKQLARQVERWSNFPETYMHYSRSLKYKNVQYSVIL